MKTRIVIISDTHDFRPDYVLESISSFKPNLLLHNGDFETQETLDNYAALAPTFHAVRGDKDELLHLPHQNVLKEGNLQIGQIHGDRPAHKERLSKYVNKLMQGRYYYWNNFVHDALSQFPEKLDILVTGHTHIPFIQKINQTVVINPGAIVVNHRSHHLKVPTLTTLNLRKGGFEIDFFMLEEGRAPSLLLVGKNGPGKDWSRIYSEESFYKPQVS